MQGSYICCLRVTTKLASLISAIDFSILIFSLVRVKSSAICSRVKELMSSMIECLLYGDRGSAMVLTARLLRERYSFVEKRSKSCILLKT